ncbi:MAG: MoxR family ATPase [Candidatus Marinimicrobia bacterium]|jgi:MoxR-like ATPase|nr:MoxR family ATPase [Candidatus Neomarinimicrobiota bacterium]
MTNKIEQLKKTNELYYSLVSEIEKVLVGQKDILKNLLISLFSGGHSFLIGVPGLAKTLMVQTIAEVMDLDFKRIQFTPDLMPSDITGTEVIEENMTTGKRNFRFIKGPVFGNIILADEINRTPPKTQAALLEAMQEQQVTSTGKTYSLDDPFFVLATQNPIEQEGTYPLPEAQLDRFMFQLNVEYPSFSEEKDIVRLTTASKIAKLKKVISKEEILSIRKFVREIPVADHLIEYAVNIVKETRPHATSNENVKKYIKWGAGPRASQYLIIGAKTKAALDGKPTPEISDINFVANNVLRHRIILNFTAEAEDISVDDIVNELIKKNNAQK